MKAIFENNHPIISMFIPTKQFISRNKFNNELGQIQSPKALGLKTMIEDDNNALFHAINEGCELNDATRINAISFLTSMNANEEFSARIKISLKSLLDSFVHKTSTEQNGGTEIIEELENSRTLDPVFPVPTMQIASRVDQPSTEHQTKKRKTDLSLKKTPVADTSALPVKPTHSIVVTSRQQPEVSSSSSTPTMILGQKQKRPIETIPTVTVPAPKPSSSSISTDQPSCRKDAIQALINVFGVSMEVCESFQRHSSFASKVTKQTEVLDKCINDSQNKLDLVLGVLSKFAGQKVQAGDSFGLMRYLATFEWVINYFSHLDRNDAQNITGPQFITLKSLLSRLHLDFLSVQIEALMQTPSLNDSIDGLFDESIDVQSIDKVKEVFENVAGQIDDIINDNFETELNQITLPEINLKPVLSCEQYPEGVRDLVNKMSLISDILLNMQSAQQARLIQILQEFLITFPIGLFRFSYSHSDKVKQSHQKILSLLKTDIMPLIMETISTLSAESEYDGNHPSTCPIRLETFKLTLFENLEVLPTPMKTMLLSLSS